MPNVSLFFLGEKYSIPSELRELIEYLRYFEKIHNELMPLLTEQIKKKTFSSGSDNDFAYFRMPLLRSGEKVIAKLAETGIFDVTLEDIVYNNKGYIKLHNICNDTMQGMRNILIKEIEDWFEGYNKAYSSAASNITGSGVSIWTSSLSHALLYSAFEASTLKKQANEADRQFKAAMESLNTSTSNESEKQQTELLANHYYPSVAEALGLYVSEMMKYYIIKLEQHGIFDYSKVKGYNLQRSSDLLKNISIVENKVGLLKEAFICCPYNPDIYNAVMENGLSDVPTFETAKYFMQDGILVNTIEKYVKRNAEDIGIITILVKILALYKGQNEQMIWRSLYSTDCGIINSFYGKLNSALEERSELIKWIKANISEYAAELCTMSDRVLTSRVKHAMQNKDVTEDKLYKLKELGIINNQSDIFLNSKTLEEMNNAYADAIISAIKQYIPELQNYLEKYNTASNQAKQKYIDAQKAHKEKINALQEKESKLKKQRATLSFFAFSKKKEIEVQIIECQNEMSELKRSNEIQHLKEEYERISRDLALLDIV